MTFRKDAILYYQIDLFCLLIVLLCLFLIPSWGFGLPLLYALPFIVLIPINKKLHSEYITIDEYGILCTRSGIQQWRYDWNSIAMLRKSTRFRLPSVEVITYNKTENADLSDLNNHYFHCKQIA